MPLRVAAYIDGFNFYYGAVKDTPYRWLDLGKLCQLLLPSHEIVKIRYFTSPVIGRSTDPDQAQRQQIYLRALETVPNLEIHLGQFQVNHIRRPLSVPPKNGPKTASIIDTREKASDVNLASYLLFDAFYDVYDLAVVFSNDSDLETPIRLTTTELSKQVGVYSTRRRVNVRLSEVATWARHVRQGPLSASQFPPTLQDHIGTITKPESW